MTLNLPKFNKDKKKNDDEIMIISAPTNTSVPLPNLSLLSTTNTIPKETTTTTTTTTIEKESESSMTTKKEITNNNNNNEEIKKPPRPSRKPSKTISHVPQNKINNNENDDNDQTNNPKAAPVRKKSVLARWQHNLNAEEKIKLEKQQIKTIVKEEEKQRKNEIKLKSYTQQHIKSTILIQKVYRGYRVRQQYQQMKKMSTVRNNILTEILETEITYVSNLKMIVDNYLRPIREQNILPKDDIRIIFSDIEILVATNKRMLIQLQSKIGTKSRSPNATIGDIFLELIPILQVYAMFINNYDRANEHNFSLQDSNKNYKKFLTKNGFSRNHLESLLITPIQRPPRYVMLLSELLKYTWPEHQDYKNLQIAVAQIKKTTGNINQKKRDADRVARLIEMQSLLIIPTNIQINIAGGHSGSSGSSGSSSSSSSSENSTYNFVQPGRFMIKEGNLGISYHKKPEQRHIFLLSDIIVITQTKKKKYELTDSPIRLQHGDIRDVSDNDFAKNNFEFVSSKALVSFSAPSIESKKEWMETLKEQINDINKKNQYFHRDDDDDDNNSIQASSSLSSSQHRHRLSNNSVDVNLTITNSSSAIQSNHDPLLSNRPGRTNTIDGSSTISSTSSSSSLSASQNNNLSSSTSSHSPSLSPNFLTNSGVINRIRSNSNAATEKFSNMFKKE